MATLLGFASTSPGGLGVFDAAMFIGLWQFDKEDLLASLLLFRMFYYILPFVIALGVLGIRELWLDVRQLAPREQGPSVAAPGSVPLATACEGFQARADETSSVDKKKQAGSER